MEPLISLAGVRKAFGRHEALRGIDLEIRPGEIVGLLGPNGSGKTTALRIIAGHLRPDDGEVTVCGVEDGPRHPEVRARIGYLPERPPLYDSLEVTSYLEFVAAAKAIPAPARPGEIDRVLTAFRLEPQRRQRISRLSKGMRQRVGLAQALLGNPDVVLLDEATNGLDPLQIIQAREMIRAAGAGRAVLFSTHIMQEVERLCSRIVILHEGRAVGTYVVTGTPASAHGDEASRPSLEAFFLERIAEVSGTPTGGSPA